MGVETLQKGKEDLQQRLGLAETQVHTLTSTLSATFSAEQGVHCQGSGSITSACESMTAGFGQRCA